MICQKLSNFVLVLVASFLLVSPSWADTGKCSLVTDVTGPINAGTFDYLQRAQNKALQLGCGSMIIRLNTPGGDLASTRKIVEKILASPIPYLCLINPQGAHAGSAGAIMMLACHVSSGLPATNLGAATPIVATGEKISDDLRQKLINDTKAWTSGLAKLRNRNEKFAEEIVTKAESITSEQATAKKVLDFVSESFEDFIVKTQTLKKDELVLGELVYFSPDLRSKVLSLVADPEISYLMFMGSLALLYFELTHPGAIAPGVLGGIGLLLSLVTMHKLEVQWGGLALILLGLVFLGLEMFVSSFGVLAIGGLVSLVVGSLLLYDVQETGYSLSLSLILGVAIVVGVICMGLTYLAASSFKRVKTDNDFQLKSREGVVVKVDESGQNGLIEIMGETWKFNCSGALKLGDKVKVKSRTGLLLFVEPI